MEADEKLKWTNNKIHKFCKAVAVAEAVCVCVCVILWMHEYLCRVPDNK